MFYRRKALLLTLLFILPALIPRAGEAGDYVIGPDDILRITVYREPELDRTVKVSSDGQMTFPLIGKVRVGGYTVSELEQVLNEKLREYLKQPHVTVFIEKYGSIAIIGEVVNPGSY